VRLRQLIRTTWGIERVDLLAILSRVLGIAPAGLLARPELKLEEGQIATIEKKIGERLSGKPLAYIVGEKEFYSEPFFVDERVLIPRPETEIVVEEVIKMIENKPERRPLMDMGTGSGAIGVTVARLRGTRVVAVDVSSDALGVASMNAKRHGVSEIIAFVCSDLFRAIGAHGRFSIVVANLPYVATGDLSGLMRDVREYEPIRALDGGANGLELYDRFVSQVPDHLEDDGAVVAEVGGAGQARALKGMLNKRGFEVEIIKDLSGIERVVKGIWKNLL
jgi:release factor glutamine methyltransferase